MSRGVLAQLEEIKLSITSVVECFPDLKTLEEKIAIKSRQHDKKKGEKRKATTQLKFEGLKKGAKKQTPQAQLSLLDILHPKPKGPKSTSAPAHMPKCVAWRRLDL